jgi:hypothetical protein
VRLNRWRLWGLSLIGLVAAIFFATRFVATPPGVRTLTNPPSEIAWQAGDLSLPVTVSFEQFVPIGDRLFLIASGNGAGDPASEASQGIWTSSDGLRWTRISGLEAIESSGSAPTLVASASNGQGGAIIVGSGSARDGSDGAAAWWTTDGASWKRSAIEGPAGRMLGVAAATVGLVAVGVTGQGGPAAWHSADGGASWSRVALPGAAREARDVTAWAETLVAIGRSEDSQDLFLWTSTNGSQWNVKQLPSDPSFSPSGLISLASTLVVLGRGVPGGAILSCTRELECMPASVPDLARSTSFTTIRAGATLGDVLVVNAISGSAGTAASPTGQGDLALWASQDGRHWIALKSGGAALVASNLVVFRERLVAMTVGPELAKATSATVMLGELR